MMESSSRNCPICGGSGTVTETYTDIEQDPGSSVAMGLALGMGYFPITRAVNKERHSTCLNCHGTGQVG